MDVRDALCSSGWTTISSLTLLAYDFAEMRKLNSQNRSCLITTTDRWHSAGLMCCHLIHHVLVSWISTDSLRLLDERQSFLAIGGQD